MSPSVPPEGAPDPASTAGAPPKSAPLRSLVAVLLSAFGVGLMMGVSLPLISLLLESRGYADSVIGLNAAAYSLAILVTCPFVPGVAARIGTVGTLVVGTVAVAGALLAFPSAEGLVALFGLRLVIGVGTALIWIASETWVTRLPAESRRGRIIAIYATLWGSGMAAGPALLSLVGTEGRAPFVVAALMIALAYAPAVAVRRTVPAVAERGRPLRLIAALGVAPVGLLAGFLSGFGEGALFSLFAVYGLAAGLTATTAVLLTTVFAAGGIALQPPTGWLADRVDRFGLLIATVVVAMLAAVAMPAAVGHPVAVWPVLFLFGGAVAGFYTLGLILIGEAFSGGDVAAGNTAFIMTYTLGGIAGPAAGGGAMDLWPPHGLMAVLALAAAAFLPVAFALRRRARPAAPAE
ncbi:MAG: MFS transporter [Azospirillaceae bacterium]